ncbi:unnamed protein product [Linum trigynum]|uniref:Rapid ALkalinization Factor n=1 Tax=Linum trigynum TaxID=586398 RepID=A0AAV2D773_9ROSI
METSLLVTAVCLCALLIATKVEAASGQKAHFAWLSNVKIRYSGPVIEYGAIEKGAVPCGGEKPCPKIPANPYERGCLRILRCRTEHNPTKASSVNENTDEDVEMKGDDVVRKYDDDDKHVNEWGNYGDQQHVIERTNSDERVYMYLKKDTRKHDNKMGRKLMGKMMMMMREDH